MDWTDFPTMPHCDQTILHAPGKCEFCDRRPDWQQIREAWRINFTGESDENKAPCPSEYFRSGELRDRWPGNRPEGYDTSWVETVERVNTKFAGKTLTAEDHEEIDREFAPWTPPVPEVHRVQWNIELEHHSAAPGKNKWYWSVWDLDHNLVADGWSLTKRRAILRAQATMFINRWVKA